MTSVTLRELGEPERVTLTSDEADAVRAESRRWKAALGLPQQPLLLERSGDGYHLSATGVTGFVAAGPLHVEIVPKFLGASASSSGWRRALWHILALTEDRPAFEPETTAESTSARSLPDLMALGFLNSIERGSARGLPRGYVEEARLVSMVQGPIDRSRMVDVVTRPWQLPCRVDLLSDDVPVNQLLRWAAHQLAATVLSPRRAQELNECAHRFQGVAPRAHPLPRARRLVLGPQHRALGPALRIAQLMLESKTLHHGRSDDALHGFLWNAPKTFEAFVLRLARAAARRLELRAVKQAIRLDKGTTAAALSSTPDIRILDGDRTVAVIDAKYKLEPGKPRAADVYQVIAAGKALGVGSVALVYPRDSSAEPDETVWQLAGAGPPTRLHSLALDLSTMEDRGGERELVARLADLVTALRLPLPAGRARPHRGT